MDSVDASTHDDCTCMKWKKLASLKEDLNSTPTASGSTSNCITSPVDSQARLQIESHSEWTECLPTPFFACMGTHDLGCLSPVPNLRMITTRKYTHGALKKYTRTIELVLAVPTLPHMNVGQHRLKLHALLPEIALVLSRPRQRRQQVAAYHFCC